jgi:RNA polymerase sigma-70 factor (ECF subfamily)
MISTDKASPRLQTDEELALRITEGDKDLFGELIDRYEAKLTRYVMRFTQEKDDVADVIQVVFIKAYTNLQSFDTKRSFNSWIYRIAHNESVTHLKKRGGEKVSFIDFDTFLPHPFAQETADEKATKREVQELLDNSLDKLSPKYREVLVLYYYDELSYQEIAEILHIPIATVGVRIKRGREALQKTLSSTLGTALTPHEPRVADTNKTS